MTATEAYLLTATEAYLLGVATPVLILILAWFLAKAEEAHELHRSRKKAAPGDSRS